MRKRNLAAVADDESVNAFILAVAGMIEILDEDNEVGTMVFLHGVRAVVDGGDYSPEVRRRIDILMEKLFASVRVWKDLR
ncbi:MAG: hypothetical protein OXH23_12740 [bacterium]|nr:hypothetical protein [bacterium]